MSKEFDIKKNSFTSLDRIHDSFALIKKIKSDLLYGNIEIDKDPFISLIIPTYSRTVFFKEALDSVLRQEETGFRWEILVVDNTPLSTDGTTPALEIVREFSCPRVLFYHNRQNIGAGYNWNRGVELARGQWVSFLHDDDLLCSDALKNIGEIIFHCLHLKKPLGYIHAKRKDFSEQFDEKAAKRHDKPFLRRLTRTGALVKGESQTGAPSCGTTILKEAYREAGGINYDFGGTADAILGYIIMKDYTVVESGKVLGGYRWAENATLRRETIFNLVEADFYFSQYRYSISIVSKFFGIMFWRIQYNQNISRKIEFLKKYNINIQKSDFNFIIPYKRCSCFKYIIYKMINKVYYFINKTCRIYI